ncbi:alpha/beta fold hydrolase [Oceanibacterium hippocampi]|uniref:Tropinesterase n=1 Tax=Oceanibacterium hippocampi TaxID=745714 RepID=A0A1Y5S294_9PROT|nr:alpha/beta hydrolase [Oceanibacterium hippocampi]SLN29613.1 Tropinesterase [Oceanibacterium hippocampi]
MRHSPSMLPKWLSIAPDWFRAAVSTPHEQHWVTVDGHRTHYLTWGDPDKPGLLLVHGGRAHARWWSFIAPYFAADYHVSAIDLGGMGDSDYRENYTPDGFAAEIRAVAARTGAGGRPVVAGHSFGGFLSLVAAHAAPAEFSGLVIVDSPIRPPHAQRKRGTQRGTRKVVYESFDAALARFRLMPEQPCANDYILDYIGRHSLKRVEGGWSWKFDGTPFNGEAFTREFWVSLTGRIEALEIPLAVLHGEKSALFTEEVRAHMKPLMAGRGPFVELPDAHHHVMLDQPLAVVAALRTQLANWRTPPRA